ncbi:MAG: dihydroorotate dehydrogenase electron transfer subunit [Phycisphaerae bacterium]|nr:dihydroorotate dehydrogenase electron transfer subunit [Phycisphaerae bacterium]MDD5381174.1 dihydroorotate dehydrogenase electron transfer subunit [Phycisphaerae bacterium]
MTNESSGPDKGMFDAAVFANKHIKGKFYRLGLEFYGDGAAAFAKARPGQFAELDLAGIPLPPTDAIAEDLRDASERKILLRRPFSFCDVSSRKDKIRVEILYCALGPATLRMTSLSPGKSVSVIGPLGNGFQSPADKKTALLVSGGMGAGPLIHLAKTLAADYPKMGIIAFAGAKSKTELPFERPTDEISQQLGFALHEFARVGVESQLATDDGSAGYEGFVTDCFTKWLGRSSLAVKDTIIYSCGPEVMLARMAKIAEDKKIDCQISMERMMACGFGLCQSCAVKCKVNGSSETIYKLCCKDGPVFDSREVAFEL